MIRVVIAVDHPVIREGLKRIVEQHPDLRIVGEAASSDEALELVRSVPADVLLLDITMPGPPLLETMERIKSIHPGPRVLVLSVHSGEHVGIRALRAGAAGYLTKNYSPEQLVDAVRRVAAGRRHVSRDLVEKMIEGLDPEAEQPPHETLSDREYQVFQRLASGYPAKSIAVQLALSPKTVSTYRSRILKKLHTDSNAGIARYAVEHGLVDESPGTPPPGV